MAYATETVISVEKSKAEIERLLIRRGASRFGYLADEDRATIGFMLNGKMLRFILHLPDRKEKVFWLTLSGRKQRTQEEAFRAWEQACRARWRSLYLVIKAKLEAIEVGITTFEEEFLAHFVLPNGEIFGDYAIPRLNQSIESGSQPQMFLTQ